MAKSRVFPTPVGVFPWQEWCRVDGLGLPHARGGVSAGMRVLVDSVPSSPRPWGCFLSAYFGRASRIVFPTPVGVFPRAMPL